MKIKLYCDSGANIHSCREEELDLAYFLGCAYEEDAIEEWDDMTDEMRNNMIEEWAYGTGLEIGYELIKE